MPIKSGAAVSHSMYGPGRVRQVVGGLVLVEFFGEEIEVPVDQLELEEAEPAPVEDRPRSRERAQLRRAYEAINLGVVPPSPDQLLALSIGGEQISREIRGWLEVAPQTGLCKVVFGDYGSGKSHHLRLVEAAGLNSGWVVSFVEFDPKQADPAKPHLVYRALMANLKFPPRMDGQQSRGFADLVREVRNCWSKASRGKYFARSPWFRPTLEAVRYFPHSADREYLDVLDWLGGQPVPYAPVRNLVRSCGGRVEYPPTLPKIKETAEIYVYNLVVVHELCKALGYKGLLLILDEAEHVRGYNVRRRERANNFFDVLSRTAHVPVRGDTPPIGNDHGYVLPKYWKEGPSFGLVVGLTEGNTFADPSLSLREACVFLHEETDRVRLKPPKPAQYEHWCAEFLARFHEHYPEVTEIIAVQEGRSRVAKALSNAFRNQPEAERTLRLWTKLASLVPSVLLAGSVRTQDELEEVIQKAAREATGELLPWDL